MINIYDNIQKIDEYMILKQITPAHNKVIFKLFVLNIIDVKKKNTHKKNQDLRSSGKSES